MGKFKPFKDQEDRNPKKKDDVRSKQKKTKNKLQDSINNEWYLLPFGVEQINVRERDGGGLWCAVPLRIQQLTISGTLEC